MANISRRLEVASTMTLKVDETLSSQHQQGQLVRRTAGRKLSVVVVALVDCYIDFTQSLQVR